MSIKFDPHHRNNRGFDLELASIAGKPGASEDENPKEKPIDIIDFSPDQPFRLHEIANPQKIPLIDEITKKFQNIMFPPSYLPDFDRLDQVITQLSESTAIDRVEKAKAIGITGFVVGILVVGILILVGVLTAAFPMGLLLILLGASLLCLVPLRQMDIRKFEHQLEHGGRMGLHCFPIISAIFYVYSVFTSTSRLTKAVKDCCYEAIPRKIQHNLFMAPIILVAQSDDPDLQQETLEGRLSDRSATPPSDRTSLFGNPRFSLGEEGVSYDDDDPSAPLISFC